MQSSAASRTGAGSGSRVTVRAGTSSDARLAAQLHAGQISDGFLSSLGPRFLELLYRRVCASEGSFLLIAESEGSRVGFLAGSASVGRLYRDFVLRDGMTALFRVAPRLLARWRRAVETLGHGRGEEAGAGMELLAVAVDPAWQGKGAGIALVEAFLEEAGHHDPASARVVVGESNHAAVSLYRRSGFVVDRRFKMHRGTGSFLMTWTTPLLGGPAPRGEDVSPSPVSPS